jgi:hypothetical protein
MTDDCKLMESNLGDFLTDQVDLETKGRIEQHLDTCERCRNELAGYEEVDRRIGVYFDRQVAIAHAAGHPQIRVGRLATAVVVAGVAAVALVLWLPGSSDIPTGGVPLAAEVSVPIDTVVDEIAKATDLPAPARAKPSTATPGEDPSAAATTTDAVSPGLIFSVTDTAGYSYALSDFRGSVLVMAVFNDQSPGTAVFQQAYEALGSTQNLRFLGVTLSPKTQPDGVTFPVMLNRGSTLLDTPAGEYVVVTAEGNVHSRGALGTESLVSTIASTLRELGL